MIKLSTKLKHTTRIFADLGSYDPVLSSGLWPLPPSNFIGSGVFKVVENGTITEASPNVTVKSGDLIFYIEGAYYPMVSPDNNNPSIAHAIFITDVVPLGSGEVYDKLPAGGDVVDSFVSTAEHVTIHFIALVGAAYTPVVTLSGGNPDTFEKVAGVAQWTGTFDVLNVATQNYTIDHDNGSSYTVSATKTTKPIITLTADLGTLPAGQTHLKAGDQFDVDWASDVALDSLIIENQEACIEESFSVSGTSGTVTVTVAARADTSTNTEFNNQHIVGRGIATTGATSDYTDSSNTVDLLNYFPQISIGSIVYSDSSAALNSTNTATVNNNVTVNGTYSITYDDIATPDLTITNPNTYEPSKVVQMSGGTSFNTDTDNFRITVSQDKNGAESTEQSIVPIIDIAPELTISNLPLEMRSGGSHGSLAQVYTMRVTSDQDLTELDIDTDKGVLGVFSEVGGDSKIWEASFTVDENNAAFDQGQITFSIVSAPNDSGIEAVALNGETDYSIKGFVARAVPLGAVIGTPSGAAFSQHGSIGENYSVKISDTANLIVKDIGGFIESYLNTLVETDDSFSIINWNIGTSTPTLNGTDGDYLYWLDPDWANNFAGAFTISIEETL